MSAPFRTFADMLAVERARKLAQAAPERHDPPPRRPMGSVNAGEGDALPADRWEWLQGPDGENRRVPPLDQILNERTNDE